jgi:hypothetical protein
VKFTNCQLSPRVVGAGMGGCAAPLVAMPLPCATVWNKAFATGALSSITALKPPTVLAGISTSLQLSPSIRNGVR